MYPLKTNIQAHTEKKKRKNINPLKNYQIYIYHIFIARFLYFYNHIFLNLNILIFMCFFFLFFYNMYIYIFTNIKNYNSGTLNRLDFFCETNYLHSSNAPRMNLEC